MMALTKIVNKLNHLVQADQAQETSLPDELFRIPQFADKQEHSAESGRKAADGQEMIVFYCLDCKQSFRARGLEDTECLEKWHYHAWLAKCPRCGAEARQTDTYWR